jgi:hypothetical protein
MADTTETRWKLVKVEATEEMHDVLRAKLLVAPSYDLTDDAEVDGIWRELIAASPPPGEEVVERAKQAAFAAMGE